MVVKVKSKKKYEELIGDSFWFNKDMCDCEVVIISEAREEYWGASVHQSVDVKFAHETEEYGENYNQTVPCFMLKKN